MVGGWQPETVFGGEANWNEVVTVPCLPLAYATAEVLEEVLFGLTKRQYLYSPD